MKKNGVLLYNIFLVIGDCLALIAAFAAAFILRGKLSDIPVANPTDASTFLMAFLTTLPFWILIFALLGLYKSNIYEKRFREFGLLFIGTFIGLLFMIFWDFLSVSPLFPAKLVPIYGFAIGFGLLVTIRTVIRAVQSFLFTRGRGITQLLLVGNTAISDEMRVLLGSRSSGYRVLGVVGDRRKNYHADFATFDEALEKIPEEALHGIIQTELYANEQRNQEVLSYAQQHHVSYRFVPGNTELFVGNIQVDLFRSSIPVIAVHQTPLLGWGQIVKRLFDLIVGGIGLVIALPFMLIIAVIIKATDPKGPVFMRGKQQGRLTRFNQIFKVYKFRTHYAKFDGKTDEEVFAMVGKPELIKQYRANGDKLKNDFRVTLVGKFLRASSLDELPQLINVVKGDISLVGPRALVPQELSEYSKKHTILSVKSGLTGLAVISGRRDIPYEERRKLDLYYVQNWTFWMDIVILLKTVRVVFGGRGAK
ncbi:MAG: sugar transferase [Candidatus Saccharimonadales bacterium]